MSLLCYLSSLNTINFLFETWIRHEINYLFSVCLLLQTQSSMRTWSTQILYSQSSAQWPVQVSCLVDIASVSEWPHIEDPEHNVSKRRGEKRSFSRMQDYFLDQGDKIQLQIHLMQIKRKKYLLPIWSTHSAFQMLGYFSVNTWLQDHASCQLLIFLHLCNKYWLNYIK